ncbi:MAG TPA: hypothetical protein VKK81_08800 [Candidatus Binatia bacterium]|nr:hypothetical protein [Candidatus Binatia bacterium]
MRKPSDLAKARKPIALDFLSRFLYVHKLPFRSDLHVVSNLLSYSQTYRVRCEEQGDINALIEFIDVCGEQALAPKWVLDRIGHTRWILSPDFLAWAKRFAAMQHCPPGTYLFDLNESPLAEKEAVAFVQAVQEHARDTLYRIGRALANVPGSGRKKELSPEEAGLRKKTSNLQSTRDRRALRYCDKAWNIYTRKTKGISDKHTLREVARSIAREKLARGGAAKKEGIRLFLERVNRTLPG